MDLGDVEQTSVQVVDRFQEAISERKPAKVLGYGFSLSIHIPPS